MKYSTYFFDPLGWMRMNRWPDEYKQFQENKEEIINNPDLSWKDCNAGDSLYRTCLYLALIGNNAQADRFITDYLEGMINSGEYYRHPTDSKKHISRDQIIALCFFLHTFNKKDLLKKIARQHRFRFTLKSKYGVGAYQSLDFYLFLQAIAGSSMASSSMADSSMAGSSMADSSMADSSMATSMASSRAALIGHSIAASIARGSMAGRSMAGRSMAGCSIGAFFARWLYMMLDSFVFAGMMAWNVLVRFIYRMKFRPLEQALDYMPSEKELNGGKLLYPKYALFLNSLQHYMLFGKSSMYGKLKRKLIHKSNVYCRSLVYYDGSPTLHDVFTTHTEIQGGVHLRYLDGSQRLKKLKKAELENEIQYSLTVNLGILLLLTKD